MGTSLKCWAEHRLKDMPKLVRVLRVHETVESHQSAA
jgi:hypothetical protein